MRRSACCRASIGRRWRRPCRPGTAPAVLLDAGATRRMQAAAPAAVRARWARCMRASALGIERRASGCSRSARKKRKGNELTREAHQLLKASALDVHRQRRGPGHLYGRRRRDRLRRIHRQRRAEVERRPRRDGRSPAAARSCRARFRARSATCCRGGRSAGSASASTTPSSAARRCSASPASCIVGHGRSSAKAVRNAVAMASRLAANQIDGTRRAAKSPAVRRCRPS